MNIKQIQALARIAVQNGLTSLDVTEGDVTISIKRGGEAAASGAYIPMQPSAPVMPQPVEAIEESGVDFNRTFEVTSPLVGVFYAAASPDAEPFVRVGSRVKKGDVLCIVEAMKLMNEITADRDGEVVDVCVRNGDVVEFGQTLFKLC